MTISDISRWARGDGLEIVLIIIGSVLLVRLTRWAADRLIRRSERKEDSDGELGMVPSEQAKHERALVQVVTWTSTFLVYFVAVLFVLERLNVPLTSLVAPATVAGVALGFGAQRIVQDLLSGFFIFAERQYGFGDVVRIAPPGDPAGITGTVEEVTLRTTRLRTLNGEVVTIPNGEIRQVTNLSKDWARVVLDIPLPDAAAVTRATELLHEIAEEMAADDQWAALLLDPPTVLGIETIGVGFVHLRFVARTQPGKQWDVGRELRRRIAEAFRGAGLVIPASFVGAEASGT